MANGRVLAPIEVATSRSARRLGLRGRPSITRPLLLDPCRQVHTMGMKCEIDVVWCKSDGRVLRIAQLTLRRVSRVVLRSAFVVEAASGSCQQWSLKVGDQIEVTNG